MTDKSVATWVYLSGTESSALMDIAARLALWQTEGQFAYTHGDKNLLISLIADNAERDFTGISDALRTIIAPIPNLPRPETYRTRVSFYDKHKVDMWQRLGRAILDRSEGAAQIIRRMAHAAQQDPERVTTVLMPFINDLNNLSFDLLALVNAGYTPDELQRIMNTLHSNFAFTNHVIQYRTQVVFFLMCTTGIRRGDLIHLQLRHIQHTAQQWQITSPHDEARTWSIHDPTFTTMMTNYCTSINQPDWMTVFQQPDHHAQTNIWTQRSVPAYHVTLFNPLIRVIKLTKAPTISWVQCLATYARLLYTAGVAPYELRQHMNPRGKFHSNVALSLPDPQPIT